MLACDLEIRSETKQLVDPQTFSDTLHMFGSHVFAGNKKLGGAFELTFFHSEQVDMQEMSELWKLIWKGFSESDGLFGSSGSGEEYSVQQLVQLGLLNSEFSESRKITKVRATTIGGARGRCTYNTWYQALENQDNCDFAIIEGKLLPIWTIIDNNINFLSNKGAVTRLLNETFNDLNSGTTQILESEDQSSRSFDTTISPNIHRG